LKSKYSIIIVPPDQNKPTRQIQFSLQGKKKIVYSLITVGLLLSGLVIHDIYQAIYIHEYDYKYAYVQQLESELESKNNEIASLNQQTEIINDNLEIISALENKIGAVLKFSGNSNLSSANNTSASLQSFNSADTLSDAAEMLDSKKALLQEYYDTTLKYVDKVDHTPSLLPVEGEISSSFGYRSNPFGGRSDEFHSGIDIACNYGTPVLATADGIVTYSGWDATYGRKVEINHGFGVVTFYGHNSKLTVSVGDQVKKGQIIAYSGNSGRSTGSHLHYGAFINGSIVDPLVFTDLNYDKEQ
jgi:murein DD-endopeptidase MepM/ murein hydrolase activator NlpD